MRLGGVSVALVGLMAACVGDSVSPGDGGTDATVESGADTGSDAGTDAAPATCSMSTPFGAPVLVSALSAASDQANLRLTADYATAFFDSTRDGGAGADDIWSASRSDAGAFSNITNVAQVNSTANDVYPTVSNDGKMLVFASERQGGADDLWIATRSSALASFGAPSSASINTADSENTPFLREDAQELYFASNRAPTQGIDDIWVVSLNGGTFGVPTHVDELASTGSDAYPVVTPDDLAIYFASDRAGGKGGTDIWVATRASASAAFGAPVIVPELNTSASDVPSFITRDRCTIYLASRTSGHFDIYVATRTP